MSDIKLVAGLDLDTSTKKLDEDIKRLKPLGITLKTILDITDEAIKRHLSDIQKVINSQNAIKIKTELDSRPIDLSKSKNETKKLQDIFSKISKEISAKISETFGITDTKALNKISRMSVEWVKLTDTITRTEVENNIFEKTYDAIKGFDSIINGAQDAYKEFVDYVNSSKIKMEPFGEDYESMRRSFGVGTIGSKSGLSMDVWYQEAREQFPGILPDVHNAEDQFQELYDVLKRGRDSLKANKISNAEIQEYFGGEDGIKEAISKILGQVSVANQEISDTKIELPKFESASFNDIENFINAVESKLEELSDSDKKIPLNFDEADVVKTVETIDSATGDVIKKVTSLNEGIGKTRQVFETVNEVTGNLEQSIEKVTDTQAKAIEKIKGDQAAASNKQYWKDEEEAIKQRTAEHKAGYESIFEEQDKLHKAIAQNIDIEIQKREDAGNRFSTQLKAELQEQARFEKSLDKKLLPVLALVILKAKLEMLYRQWTDSVKQIQEP